ncbi:MAG: hypothetical protein R3345_08505, partial [Fulvivirga sp.]|nr:hypothetical protein [Fulvivirga sp.]
MRYFILIRRLLDRSYDFLRQHYENLLVIGALQAILGVSAQIIDPFQGSGVKLLFGVSGFILILLVNVRLGITLLLYIRDNIKNRNTTLKEAFFNAKDNFWTYLGAVLMVMLIVVIPVILFYIIFILIDVFVINIFIGLLGIAVSLYLLVHFYFTPIICVLNPEEDKSLNRSYQLVNDQKLKAVGGLMAILTLQLLP